ncbi:MAG: YcgN family cysteine cluster protein [Gammaproteobacteria bacterium]
MTERFWETKALNEMSASEWESLCDGCAKCCMFQFEDEDTGHLMQTDVVCGLLDIEQCQCTDYANRTTLVPDCIQITPENILTLNWMPESCSYRQLALGNGLPDWHPLLTSDRASTRDLGHSVRGKVVSANEVDDIESRIISWFEP